MSTRQAEALHAPVPAFDGPQQERPVRDERPSPAGRIVRNTIALSFSRPLTWISAIGLTVLLPRYLGDVNLGKINFAFAFADWCGLLASCGISTYLTKEVARRGTSSSSLVLNALVMRLSLALGVGGLASVVATFMGFDELTRQLIYLLTAHMLLMVISGVLIGALQGVEQLRIVALVDAVSKLVQLGLVAFALVQGYGPLGVAVAWILSDLFAIAWYLHAVRKHTGLSGPLELRTWRSLISGGVPFLVWETALLTYARIDVVILSMFAHDAVLGWYGAAYRIISIPLFAPAVIMTATFPALSASAKDPALFSTIARRAVHVVVLMTLPMALGLMVLADKLIELFGYPQSFANSVVPIALLAASLPLVGINMIVGSVLNARDRQRQWAVAGVAAAVLNPALNLVAIPYTQSTYGNGAIGAAAVTSLTEVFLLVVGQCLIPRRVLDAATFAGILKCLLAGLAMVAVVWFARELPVMIAVTLGALTYGVGALSLGIVSVGDLRRLRHYLTERRAGSPAPA
jgi:O-antigen/teichoic acid export membrane protein